MTIRDLGKRETELGMYGHWRLSSFAWARPTSRGWHRFKLYDARRGRRRRDTYWLWYDGSRFTQTNPVPVLKAFHPEILDWARMLIVDHVGLSTPNDEGETP